MKKEESKNKLPESCMFEVSKLNKKGDLLARTVNREDNPDGVKIYIIENRQIKPALAVGDKFLGKTIFENDVYYTKPITRTEVASTETEMVYGIIEKRDDKYYVIPAEKNNYMSYMLDKLNKSKEGDFVKIELCGNKKFKTAKIVKNFGTFDLNKATASLILEKYEIPLDFSPETIQETVKMPKFHIKGREDLRNVPLVTIDGDDSRDFDDAIYAQKTDNGFLLIVAIADVAFYVKSGTSLDKDAYKRGNSVYLPNMVVPMLPEILCNDLCSLCPKEERASMVCFIDIDNEGNINKYDFKRAVIKSAARLTYNEVQDAIDGKQNENTSAVYDTAIKPIYDAYLVLQKARKKRGALELELDEIKVKVDKDGFIKSIEKEEHLTSHQIVEEFMIAANVSAAKALGKAKLPTMYRIHEKPKEEKLRDIEPLLHSLGLKLPTLPSLMPSHFNNVLEVCKEKGYSAGISDLILRLQCQAKYSPNNLGHFGLWLTDYAHFTSPIRRYSDLLIHRALIKAYDMPDGGGLDTSLTHETFEEYGEHLCVTERKAVSAERDTVSRFLSSYLEPSIGQNFDVKISGISTAGLFVRVESIGAEGLIPMRSLPDDNYTIEQCCMFGPGNKLKFEFGDLIKVQLIEASPVTGGLIFKYVDPEFGVEYKDKGNKFWAGAGRFKKEPKKKLEKEPKEKVVLSKKKKAKIAKKKARKEQIKKTNREKKKNELQTD